MYMKWSNLFCLFPRRCAPLIAPSSRFATPDPTKGRRGLQNDSLLYYDTPSYLGGCKRLHPHKKELCSSVKGT